MGNLVEEGKWRLDNDIRILYTEYESSARRGVFGRVDDGRVRPRVIM